MTDRKTLYNLVDQIVDEDMEEARRLLKELLDAREKRSSGRKMTDEERIKWMESLPEEGYDISDAERAEIEEGEKAIREGRVVPFDKVAKELGL